MRRPPHSPGNLFQVLVLDSARGRRAMALRMGGSLLLGAPLLFLPMGAAMRCAGVTLLVVFAGLFGAVVGAARLRSSGLGERLELLPLGRWWALADRVLAGALLDAVQIVPVVLGVLVLHGHWTEPAALVAVAGILGGTLVVLNGLGLALATRLGSNAEAHLWGALAAGAVALLSGLFPVSGRLGGVVQWTAPVLPPHHLQRALLDVVSGGGTMGPAAAGLGVVVLALLMAAVAARTLNVQGSGCTAGREGARATD